MKQVTVTVVGENITLSFPDHFFVLFQELFFIICHYIFLYIKKVY